MKSTRVFPRELTMFCQKRQPRTLGIAERRRPKLAESLTAVAPAGSKNWLVNKIWDVAGIKRMSRHLDMYIALVILFLPLRVFITFGYNHVQDQAVLWHIRHSETICHLQGSYPKNKHDCLMVHRNCGLVHPVGLVQVWLG